MAATFFSLIVMCARNNVPNPYPACVGTRPNPEMGFTNQPRDDAHIARASAATLPTFHKLLVVPGPHGAAHDLAHARHEHVHGLGEARVVGAALHVERLDLRRELAQQDRLPDRICHLALWLLRDVLTSK